VQTTNDQAPNDQGNPNFEAQKKTVGPHLSAFVRILVAGRRRRWKGVGHENAQKSTKMAVGVPLYLAWYRFVPLAAAWRKNILSRQTRRRK
jgi:hypothetical protein